MWIDSEVGDYALQPDHLGTVLQPLAEFYENMIVPSGIPVSSLRETGTAATHGGVTMNALTGSRMIGSRTRPGPTGVHVHESIDFKVGTYLSEEYGLPSQRVYPHLFLTDYAEAGDATFCADASGNQIRSIAGLENVVNTLFGGLTVDSSQPSVEARLAVLEKIQPRLASLRPQLINANASTVMDAYRDSITALRDELAVRAGRSCEPPSVDTGIAERDPLSCARMHEVIYHAFACDMASSLTYAIGGEQINQMRHGSLPGVGQEDADVQAQLTPNHHAHSHVETAAAYRAQEFVRIWHMQQLAGLLGQLKATPDVDGTSTLFDNTAVFILSAMSDNVHGAAEIPYLMIAGDNTNLKTGFHYDCAGRTNNDLMTTLAQGLHVPITEFGAHNQDQGKVAGLNNGPIGKLLKEEV